MVESTQIVVCVCVCMCVCVCVRACVRACVCVNILMHIARFGCRVCKQYNDLKFAHR